MTDVYEGRLFIDGEFRDAQAGGRFDVINPADESVVGQAADGKAADVEAAAEEVKNGVGLATALGKGKRFPRLALQMVQVGEESGALDAMLLKTADTFEQETGQALDRMLAALVPAITMVLALVVMAVILAVLVPVYDLTSVIG
jgi:general secretion pathway protein F